VLGDFDLGLGEDLLEVADAEGAGGEEVQHAQAGAVAQALVDAKEVHGDRECRFRNIRKGEYRIGMPLAKNKLTRRIVNSNLVIGYVDSQEIDNKAFRTTTISRCLGAEL
jgi:hypothetical protein